MAKMVAVDRSFPEGTLKHFEMIYFNGYPGLHYTIGRDVNLFILKNRFVIKARTNEYFGKPPFNPLVIKYSNVISFEHVPFRSKDIRKSNALDLTFKEGESIITIRLLILPKSTRKKNYLQCMEILDFLRENNLSSKFGAEEPIEEQKSEDVKEENESEYQKATSNEDLFAAIEKLGYLYRQGILTFDEFQSKKEELLKRI